MQSAKRTIFSGFITITLAVIIMIMGVSSLLNAGCQSAFDANLPIHPAAQNVTEDFPFLGDKWMKFYVPLSTTEVRTWYNHAIYPPQANDVKQGTHTAWQGDFEITPATNGTGVSVLLSVNCQ